MPILAFFHLMFPLLQTQSTIIPVTFGDHSLKQQELKMMQNGARGAKMVVKAETTRFACSSLKMRNTVPSFYAFSRRSLICSDLCLCPFPSSCLCLYPSFCPCPCPYLYLYPFCGAYLCPSYVSSSFPHHP